MGLISPRSAAARFFGVVMDPHTYGALFYMLLSLVTGVFFFTWVVTGLSLFLTFFVMGPTFDRVYQEAYVPYSTNAITFEQAVDKAQAPMRAFMLKQTRQSDFALFARLARLEPEVTAEKAPFRVIVPAFVISELKTAFQIGFMIFIPFLVIDMVVASILMSLGMMMLSPVLVALPFKLMLFVLADGWNLLIGSLAASFAT